MSFFVYYSIDGHMEFHVLIDADTADEAKQIAIDDLGVSAAKITKIIAT